MDGLREALDINDDGWIVCWGDGDLTSLGFNPHCYLLSPAPDCPEDVTGDGQVNIDDTFAILAAWGLCGKDGGGGEGHDLAIIFADWLDAGGAAALDKGLITWDDILLCLKNDSDAEVKACLYALLKE